MNDHILQWAPAVEDALNKYARKLSKDRKDDLRQEVYLALLQLEEEVLITSSEQAFRVAQKVLNRERMSSKREDVLTEDDINQLNKKDAELFRCWNFEDESLVDEAVQKLPPLLRYLIIDLYFAGLTQEEAANNRGITQQAVGLQKKKALKLLNIYITKEKQKCR
jgi:RNA polymerase sigma factor (sigma-70 family)